MKVEDYQKEAEAKMRVLAQSFYAAFTSDQGAKVLEHLVNKFVMDNETNLGSTNINYEAAYRNGEAGVIKYILNQIKRSQQLEG